MCAELGEGVFEEWGVEGGGEVGCDGTRTRCEIRLKVGEATGVENELYGVSVYLDGKLF